VDDVPDNLALLGQLLTPLYEVSVANSGSRALLLAGAAPKPDLILLDVMMPQMDGFAVFEQLRANPATSDIPVIFVTAMNHTADEIFGLDAGAVDYIMKPLRPAIVLARVRAQLEIKLTHDWLREQKIYLEEQLAESMVDLDFMQELGVHALGRLTDLRDRETGNHLRRAQQYMNLLARELCAHPRFSQFLTAGNIDILLRSASLHDIGKVGIPDYILKKAGRLTEDEMTIIKSHSALGATVIEQAETDARRPAKFLKLAKEIALYHHEKWDGSGYPYGLAGDAIPPAARMMALADVFDALIFRRAYKMSMSFEEARVVIEEGRGSHFDPDIATVFLQNYDGMCDIATRFADTEDMPQHRPHHSSPVAG
jgi:putative two-component system response regulator